MSREQPSDVLDFVSGEVVEDERVTLVQLRTEHLLKISGKNIGIDGAFD